MKSVISVREKSPSSVGRVGEGEGRGMEMRVKVKVGEWLGRKADGGRGGGDEGEEEGYLFLEAIK